MSELINIPKKVKVGGLVYTVEICKGLNKEAGEMDTTTQIIKIEKATPGCMGLTFIHELLHAINNEIGEIEIEFLAQGLFQIIADNPKVFRGGEAK